METSLPGDLGGLRRSAMLLWRLEIYIRDEWYEIYFETPATGEFSGLVVAPIRVPGARRSSFLTIRKKDGSGRSRSILLL